MIAPIAHTGGSQQLRLYRRARDLDGLSQADAIAAGGGIITPKEAEIYDAADAAFPPPPEAYELLGKPKKEDDMASAAKDTGEGSGITGEYSRPDAKTAFKIYREEIAPKKAHMATLKGDLSDPHKRIKDDCHFPRKVMDFLVSLDEMEDAKRDHFLLAMNLGMAELGMTLPRDLVTMAEGKDGDNIIPMGERKKPQLATLPIHEGDNADLADGDDTPDAVDRAEDDFTEATEEELAAQKGRAETKAKKASVATMKPVEETVQ